MFFFLIFSFVFLTCDVLSLPLPLCVMLNQTHSTKIHSVHIKIAHSFCSIHGYFVYSNFEHSKIGCHLYSFILALEIKFFLTITCFFPSPTMETHSRPATILLQFSMRTVRQSRIISLNYGCPKIVMPTTTASTTTTERTNIRKKRFQ